MSRCRRRASTRCTIPDDAPLFGGARLGADSSRELKHLQKPSPTTTSRRRFLDWFLGTSVGALAVAIVYPIARFVSPPVIPEAQTHHVDAGPTNDPELVEKGFKIVRFGVEPIILIKAPDGGFRAFTATCTHLDCIVDYRRELELIWCWCHNGIYDLTGKNIGGPPPRPLTPFEVALEPQSAGQPDRIVISKT